MQPWRISTILGFVIVLFLGVVFRLAYWQLYASDPLKAQAESQRSDTAKTIGQRGTIVFSDGSSLVSSKISYLVFAEKKFIEKPEDVAKQLAAVTGLPETSISAKLSQNLQWIPVFPQISAEVKRSIEALNIKGIGFDKKEQRFYPEASMAANVVGFVGKDDAGRDKGYFGLEGFYNNMLTGKEGYIQQEKDVTGRPILTAYAEESEPKPGSTLELYIDRTVQYIAEKRLKEGIDKFGAASGDVVIMDPNTGGVLAMAAFPSYNPAEYYTQEGKNFKNPIVSDTYEPGSTFKSIIMASAINEGAIKPETTCPCDAFRKIGEYTIRNWDNAVHPDSTMNDVLKNSDNNGMIFVGDKLGKEKLVNYIQLFGIGSLSNVDLQNEEAPKLRDKKEWYQIDYATATFGQGIAVTPLQLIRAVSVIANGGRLMEPHIVKKITTPEGKEIEVKPKIIAQILKEETTKTVTQMLIYTVDNGEAGRLYKPKGFKVAAKSGTAQIAMAGKYGDDSQVISSYIGYAPADNPKFIALVRFKQPRGGLQGATTAGPVFYKIAKDLFTYYGIPPTEEQ